MKNINLGLLILRVSLGVMMLLHGIEKMGSGVGHIQGMLAEKGFSVILSYGVFMGEVIAPILMIAGFRTKLASIILVINCIFIMLLGPYNITGLGKYGGWNAELPGLFLFGALALVFTGGGNYAFSKQNKWD